MTELDNIKARQGYGIHRASDYEREYDLTRTWRTTLAEFAIYAFLIAFGCLKFWAIAQMFL